MQMLYYKSKKQQDNKLPLLIFHQIITRQQ